MSAAAAVLETLAARGAVVTICDGVLRVTPRAAIDDLLRAEIRAHKPALLRLLAPPQNRPASTCSKIKRVALAAPTDHQWEAMSADSYAAAELLRRRLVADGVIFKVEWRFGCDRLCVEWQKMAPDDWHAIVAHRAELFHMHTTRETAAEFEVGEAYKPDEALREIREMLDKQQNREP